MLIINVIASVVWHSSGGEILESKTVNFSDEGYCIGEKGKSTYIL